MHRDAVLRRDPDLRGSLLGGDPPERCAGQKCSDVRGVPGYRQPGVSILTGGLERHVGHQILRREQPGQILFLQDVHHTAIVRLPGGFPVLGNPGPAVQFERGESVRLLADHSHRQRDAGCRWVAGKGVGESERAGLRGRNG